MLLGCYSRDERGKEAYYSDCLKDNVRGSKIWHCIWLGPGATWRLALISCWHLSGFCIFAHDYEI